MSHPEEAEKAAKEIIGMTLVTHQTGPAGRLVRKVLIEEGVEVQEELYLGAVIDRAKACPVIMASREGGVEIEKVAAESPEIDVGVAHPSQLGALLTARGKVVRVQTTPSGDFAVAVQLERTRP